MAAEGTPRPRAVIDEGFVDACRAQGRGCLEHRRARRGRDAQVRAAAAASSSPRRPETRVAAPRGPTQRADAEAEIDRTPTHGGRRRARELQARASRQRVGWRRRLSRTIGAPRAARRGRHGDPVRAWRALYAYVLTAGGRVATSASARHRGPRTRVLRAPRDPDTLAVRPRSPTALAGGRRAAAAEDGRGGRRSRRRRRESRSPSGYRRARAIRGLPFDRLVRSRYGRAACTGLRYRRRVEIVTPP